METDLEPATNPSAVVDEGGAKRRQIMSGAREVFLSQGFDGASMNDVARVAGVSKGTLYAYFDSKENLFESLIREQKREQAEQMTSDRFEDGDDVCEALRAFGCELLEMMNRPDHLALLRTVIAASAKFPRIGRTFFETGPEYGAKRLAEYFQRKNDQGVLMIRDFEFAAWQFLALSKCGTLLPLIFREIDEVSALRIKATVDAAVDMFIAMYGADGIKAQRAGEARLRETV